MVIGRKSLTRNIIMSAFKYSTDVTLFYSLNSIYRLIYPYNIYTLLIFSFIFIFIQSEEDTG